MSAAVSGGELDRCGAVGRLAGDLTSAAVLSSAVESGPDELVVVDQQHADHRTGTAIRQVVPVPGRRRDGRSAPIDGPTSQSVRCPSGRCCAAPSGSNPFPSSVISGTTASRSATKQIVTRSASRACVALRRHSCATGSSLLLLGGESRRCSFVHVDKDVRLARRHRRREIAQRGTEPGASQARRIDVDQQRAHAADAVRTVVAGRAQAARRARIRRVSDASSARGGDGEGRCRQLLHDAVVQGRRDAPAFVERGVHRALHHLFALRCGTACAPQQRPDQRENSRTTATMLLNVMPAKPRHNWPARSLTQGSS